MSCRRNSLEKSFCHHYCNLRNYRKHVIWFLKSVLYQTKEKLVIAMTMRSSRTQEYFAFSSDQMTYVMKTLCVEFDGHNLSSFRSHCFNHQWFRVYSYFWVYEKRKKWKSIVFTVQSFFVIIQGVWVDEGEAFSSSGHASMIIVVAVTLRFHETQI